MCKGLIAKKAGMSRVFLETGEAVPVTYLEVEPNIIVRTKTEEKDGYNAVVLGIGPKKWKTRKGKEHTKFKVQKEWQVESLEGLDPGTELTAKSIPAESIVTVSGISKGKGFQGVIKRHGFHGGPKTHGSHSHRRGGSIGMCAFPGRVLKGQKMPGRMGNDKVTLSKRPVLTSDPEKGVICVKGPVPGPTGATVFVTVESSPESKE
ncbi:MAG: 50S ribosomal protein L3 [Candidatus Peribacteraceae bacterium]|nr:50S ribosomal protein L3 [Candidatus Peribacteraceae bacterium]HCI03960.1 50S ribosomal protein L3 [Candidatus Peribacteria bacterium]